MKIKKQWIIFCLLLIGIIADVWCSYNILTVHSFTYKTNQVCTPIKAVVIADLHDHSFGHQNEKLIKKIRETNPDIICMVGDFVNEDSDNPNTVYTLVEELTKNYPVYFSLGNHELDYIEHTNDTQFLSKLRELGAVVLDKNYEDIIVNGNQIRIGGMYDYAFGVDGFDSAEAASQDVQSFLMDFQNTDAFTLMLAHRPDSFIFGNASSYWDIDLVLSGHNHGGQVVLPFLGGLYGGDQGFFPEYVHGLYQKDAMHLFITSGLGSHKEKLPRFHNLPEIALLTIEPK